MPKRGDGNPRFVHRLANAHKHWNFVGRLASNEDVEEEKRDRGKGNQFL